MKKKAIKIAASTAVAASAFVAAAPANKADAAVNLDQIVQDAQNAGTVLKWAISVEGSADYVTRPYDQYNAAKKAIDAAEKALKGASASDKLKYEARLTDPKIQVKRAQAYIDAITSSEKIKELTANLNAAVKSDDIEKVETAYHKATAEYRKQSALLDRVYGQSTRDGIRNAVKPALEKLVAELKNDVTVNMLAKAAAADVKAGKTVDAGKKIAEAQAILDANVLKWETNLQKSVNDVLASLPLTVTSVTRVNDTTVVVNLNKAVDAVYSSDFTFDNGLIATSVALSSDKKSVTVTTTKQELGKTYTVYYKGTSGTFSSVAVTPPSSVDGSAIYSDLGNSEVIVATFKDKNGKVKKEPVTIDPAGLKIVSVNGATPGTNQTSFIPNDLGQLTVVVTADSTVSVLDQVIKFTQGTDDPIESKKISFFKVDESVTLTDAMTVDYVDSAKTFFIVKDAAGIKQKIKIKSNDVLQDASKVSADSFKSKLSKGDIVVGTYNPTPSASVLNLLFDKPAGFDFKVNEESPVRVDTKHVTFTGTGEAGKYVTVYNSNGVLVGSKTINSNGTWSIEAEIATTTDGVFYIGTHTDLSKTIPQTRVVTDADLTKFEVIAGKVTAVVGGDNAYDKTVNGLTLTFTSTDELKINDGATITLVDGNGATATFTDGKENTEFKLDDTKKILTVKFGYTSSSKPFSGVLTIQNINKVTNKDGLNLKPAGLDKVNVFAPKQ